MMKTCLSAILIVVLSCVAFLIGAEALKPACAKCENREKVMLTFVLVKGVTAGCLNDIDIPIPFWGPFGVRQKRYMAEMNYRTFKAIPDPSKRSYWTWFCMGCGRDLDRRGNFH